MIHCRFLVLLPQFFVYLTGSTSSTGSSTGITTAVTSTTTAIATHTTISTTGSVVYLRSSRLTTGSTGTSTDSTSTIRSNRIIDAFVFHRSKNNHKNNHNNNSRWCWSLSLAQRRFFPIDNLTGLHSYLFSSRTVELPIGSSTTGIRCIMEQSSSSSTSSSSTTALSVEQLRFKRLIAFGLQNAVPIKNDIAPSITAATTSTGSTFTTGTGTTTVAAAAAAARKTTMRHDNVIDLMDDSTDDDDNIDYHHRKRKHNTPNQSNNNDNTKRNIQQRPGKIYSKKSNDDPFVVHDVVVGDDETQPSMRESVKQQHAKNYTSTSTSTTGSTNSNNNNNTNTTKCFQMATWNVWFGPWGDGNPHSTVRMKEITRLLLEQHHPSMNPVYCIGFQEVVPETIVPLKASLLQQQYHWYEQPSRTVPYKCAMAIHQDLIVVENGWIPYTQTVMQRGFLYVRAKLPSSYTTTTGNDNNQQNEILFTTTHLESFNGKDYNGASQRLLQIQEMCAFVQDQMDEHAAIHTSFLSGDFNWDDERTTVSSTTKCNDPNLLSSIPSNWKDTWLEVTTSPPTTAKPTTTTAVTGRKKSTTATTKLSKKTLVEGYTYDSKLNPMLGGSLRRRFDRILVLQQQQNKNHQNPSEQKQLQIMAPQLLGTEAIAPDLTWEKYNSYTRTTRNVPTAPSDHFGYIVTVCFD